MTKPPERHLRPIEEHLGTSLAKWKNFVTQAKGAVVDPRFSPKTQGQGHAEQLAQVIAEIEAAEGDLRSIEELSKAAKAEAEYREVLVRAWPTNHFLDRLAYLGAALLGAGGAGFVLAGWFVAAVFWAVGLILMGLGLYGLYEWERKRWDFHADQFYIDPKYRPLDSRWGWP